VNSGSIQNLVTHKQFVKQTEYDEKNPYRLHSLEHVHFGTNHASDNNESHLFKLAFRRKGPEASLSYLEDALQQRA